MLTPKQMDTLDRLLGLLRKRKVLRFRTEKLDIVLGPIPHDQEQSMGFALSGVEVEDE